MVSQLRTGDILLVRDPQCAHTPACLAQNLLCWTVNHVGLAINPKDFSESSALHMGTRLDYGKRYLRITRGNQCGQGSIWVRQVLCMGTECNQVPPVQLVYALERFLGEDRGKRYEQSCCALVGAYCDSCERLHLCKNRGDDSSLFCSELVALILQEGHVLGKQRPADEFVPMDFMSSNGVKVERAELCPGFRLAPARQLVSDGPTSDGPTEASTLAESDSSDDMAGC